MGKLDILKFIAEDLSDECNIHGSIYININSTTITNSYDTTISVYCQKLLCTLCMLKLIDDNKLFFDDALDRFIPEYSHSSEISIGSLLLGLSGIPDYIYFDSTLTDTQIENICSIINSKPLDKRYKNSTTDIAFIRCIIERTCNADIISCITKYVFAPLSVDISFTNEAFIFTSEELIKFTWLCLYENKLLSDTSWQKLFSFNTDSHGISCKNDNGFIRFTLKGIDENTEICIDKQNKVLLLFTVSADAKYEAFIRTLLDNIEILTVYPVRPKLSLYDEFNAGRASHIMPEIWQLNYVCDAKAALCYAYSKPTAESYALTDGNRVIGISVISRDTKFDIGCIDMLMIDKKYQHKGYGKYLIELSLEKLRSCSCIEIAVHKENLHAMHIYQHYGFKVTLEQSDYYILELRQVTGVSVKQF